MNIFLIIIRMIFIGAQQILVGYTGHSYIIYGPLANGATTLMFEGIPNYPNFSRFWQIIDKHKVNIFYTAPHCD